MNLPELINFLKCINEGCACSSDQINGMDLKKLSNLLKCINEECTCSSRQTNCMDFRDLTNLLKCINEGMVCSCPKSDILTPWQMEELNKSQLPTNNVLSLQNSSLLLADLKRLERTKEYRDLKETYYFLLIYKKAAVYSVYALGRQREIIARFEDYCQAINDQLGKPIQEMIIIEAKI